MYKVLKSTSSPSIDIVMLVRIFFLTFMREKCLILKTISSFLLSERTIFIWFDLLILTLILHFGFILCYF